MTDHNLFRGIDERIDRDKEEGDQVFFFALMLKLELIIKLVTASIISCLRDDVDRHRYSLERKLIRSNSLGDWTKVLDQATKGPPAQVLLHEARYLTKNITERVKPGDWRYSVVEQLSIAAKNVGVENVQINRNVSLSEFFDLGVQIRNRTRGHGAATTLQCANACSPLGDSLNSVVENAEVFRRQWVYLHQNLSRKFRVLSLLNGTSTFNTLKSSTEYRYEDGVYFTLRDDESNIEHALPIRVPLVFTDPDVLDIRLPNGNHNGQTQDFETLSYVTNSIRRQDGSSWSNPPDRLPESETEGREVLDIIGNIFTNAPATSSDYIHRKGPEEHLFAELSKSDHHPIISLTGPGGVGKTSIAVAAIKKISQISQPPFDCVVWISARDIDLLDTGPKPVSRRVFTEKDISCAVVNLLRPRCDQKNFNAKQHFQELLSNPSAGKTLYVLDNFETLQNPIDIFQWLDTYIRLPNKVLITTRFRDFHGDYPIEIDGMSMEESKKLIDRHAIRLGIKQSLKQTYIETLISDSGGHPYAIKILLAEISKKGKPRKLEQVFGSADAVLDALFERTFASLSPASQRIFLLLCSWRVPVPEIAVEAVSLSFSNKEKYDVSDALDELSRYSLVELYSSNEDNSRLVEVPLVATIFGRKELTVNPHKISVQEDRKLLLEFGVSRGRGTYQQIYPRVEKFFRYVANQAANDSSELSRLKPILEYLSRKIPRAYLLLVELNKEFDYAGDLMAESKDYIRKYLKTGPTPIEVSKAWKQMTVLSRLSDDTLGEFQSLGELAQIHSSDLSELSEIANSINSRIRELKYVESEFVRSTEVRIILNSIIEIIEKQLPNLSASDCSRLAWLYLNVGNSERAYDIAKIGTDRDRLNEHCIGLIDKLAQY